MNDTPYSIVGKTLFSMPVKSLFLSSNAVQAMPKDQGPTDLTFQQSEGGESHFDSLFVALTQP